MYLLFRIRYRLNLNRRIQTPSRSGLCFQNLRFVPKQLQRKVKRAKTLSNFSKSIYLHLVQNIFCYRSKLERDLNIIRNTDIVIDMITDIFKYRFPYKKHYDLENLLKLANGTAPTIKHFCQSQGVVFSSIVNNRLVSDC